MSVIPNALQKRVPTKYILYTIDPMGLVVGANFQHIILLSYSFWTWLIADATKKWPLLVIHGAIPLQTPINGLVNGKLGL